MTEPMDLGARERQIVDAVFRLGRATVQEVRDEIPDPPSYSAIRGMLNMLEAKGFLRHENEGLKYVYFSSVPKEKARLKALKHLVHVYFEGSADAAAAALLDLPGKHVDGKEIERLRQLIDRRAGKKERGEA